MAKENIYKNISDWISKYEPINNDWIYFNLINYELGFVSLNSVSMSRILKEDVTGAKTIEFVVAVNMTKQYDNGTSDNNIEAIQEVMNFQEWVEIQYKNKNLPKFDEEDTINNIEVLENVPNMSVDADNNIAKYMFQIKFTVYREE